MNDRRDETGALEEGGAHTDMNEEGHVGFGGTQDNGAASPETHHHHDRHDPTHVDLMQDDYTPEEAARLMGTSLEVVMHAIYGGDLKAERQGNNVVCIQHADLTDWLRRRAAE